MRLYLLNPSLGLATWFLLALVLVSDAWAETDSLSSQAPSGAVAAEFEESQQVAATRLPFEGKADTLEVDPSIAAAETVVDGPLPYEIIELNRGETFNLFSMGKKVWGDTGIPVRVFVLPSRHALHKQFAKQKIGSFPHVLSAIWDRHVYSGSGQRPNEVKNEQEMLRAISSIEGAVGYLPDPADSNQIIVVRNK